MEASELKEILGQHKLWIETNGKQGERAKLQGADLRGANLEFANLTGAILTGANLTGATLEGATLTHADLWDANLVGATLMGANLRGANLTGADLTGANLRVATLTGAILTGAYLQGANLRGANLSGAIGLPDIFWIIPGCLAQLNEIKYYGFYLAKENKSDNFIQDSFGFIIENNGKEGTFDMLVEDRVIRNIPDWVKLSGLRQTSAEPI